MLNELHHFGADYFEILVAINWLSIAWYSFRRGRYDTEFFLSFGIEPNRENEEYWEEFNNWRIFLVWGVTFLLIGGGTIYRTDIRYDELQWILIISIYFFTAFIGCHYIGSKSFSRKRKSEFEEARKIFEERRKNW